MTSLGLLVLSGSSGRLETQRCEVLTAHGIDAQPATVFGGPGQPAAPHRVPLESLTARLDELASRHDRIGVLGTSFGAEAALLLAVRDPRLSLVVALAPTSVVWRAPEVQDGLPVVDAKWTWQGRSVAGVPYVDPTGRDFADAREWHEASLEEFAGSRAAVEIPVERIEADLLVTAGGDDRVWPADAFCEEIMERRAASGRDTSFVFHPSAGHRSVLPGEESPPARPDLPAGGNPAADREFGAEVLAELLTLAKA